ncbi:MAG: TetR/AcrR family transcriptional regulator [Actinobacteria bacterium]|nr:TetR/AcrR family transcriptional regulator [Actinomycetota bacterium]
MTLPAPQSTHTPNRSRGPSIVARARGRQPATAQASEETRARIIDATIETLKTEGIVGASARAIARTGAFNQALIYYHFGSINDVMVAALAKMGERRIDLYEERLAGVTTFPQLARVGAELHKEDAETGNITVLVQMLAGAVGEPALGPRLYRSFKPWTDLVEQAIRNVLEGSAFEDAFPVEDLAFAVSSLFFGIELLTDLDPDTDREDSLFRTIGLIAVLVDAIMTTGTMPAEQPAAAKPARRATKQATKRSPKKKA